MIYKINPEYKGLSVTKQVMGLGNFTLNTNRDYTQEQLKNYSTIFKGIIIEDDEVEDDSQPIEYVEIELKNMSYTELYTYASGLKLRYPTKPKKSKLIEDISSLIEWKK